MKIDIMEKPKKNIKKDIKILNPKDVTNIKEVKSIRNAIKEYLLFIGLDNGNNVRNVSLLGIGSTHNVIVDTKEIIRVALFSASDKVILVHNHPSDSLEPSSEDIHITNVTNQILKVFNIQLLDHIIVSKDEYVSMESVKKVDRNYTNSSLNEMEKGFLIEENKKMKQQIIELQEEIRKNKSLVVLSAEYIGNYNDTTVYNVEISLNGKKECVTVEKKYNDRDSNYKWEVVSNLALKEEEINYIVQTISKNPPAMSIDDSMKEYDSLSVDEIEMEG